jgi:adenosylmethionine-8-amino-7-oxononanoate aminotransferase
MPQPLFMPGALAQLTIERAEGAYLFTADGRRILDAGAGAVVVHIGQGRREIAELAADVIGRVNYVVPIWDTPERARLCEHLQRWLPSGLTRYFFTSGGSEAIEMAIKFAIMYQGRVRGNRSKRKIISRRFSYHGNTLAALSAGSNLRRGDYEHVLIDWPKIDASFCYRCPYGRTYPACDVECATALEREIVRQGPENVAAFLAEPMMGSAAAAVPPVPEYWPRVAEICRQYDVLLIADEVMTGFGRTGRRFAVDHWNVVPDVLVGGKGLTGGYAPMGMIAVAENRVAECERAGAEFMFFTYSSHPLTCAIADRVLEIMERERLVERAAEIGARLGARLKEELSGHPMVGDIRGAGMFWGIEFVRDRKEKVPFERSARITPQVIEAALRRGLFVYPSTGMAGDGRGDAVMITPPFVIGDQEIDFIIATLRAVFDEVWTATVGK